MDLVTGISILILLIKKDSVLPRILKSIVKRKNSIMDLS
jgi:hypothetical protein